MRIDGKFIGEPSDGIFLILDDVVDVANVCHPQEILGIQRKISGKIVQEGPDWKSYESFWSRWQYEFDGEKYFSCSNVTIDYDVYQGGFMSLNHDNLRIILHESYYGDIARFPEDVKTRNNRAKEWEAKILSGQLTRSEMSQLCGHPKITDCLADFVLPSEVLEQLKSNPIVQWGIFKLTKNIIV